MDCAGVTRCEAGEDSGEGGFAGAVATDEGMDFAGQEIEIKIDQDRDAVALLEGADVEERSSVGH